MKAVLVTTLEKQLERSAYVLSKHDLFNALGNPHNAYITINGIRVTLSSIMREDGSGKSFILRVVGPDNNIYTTYTRAA